MVANSLFLTIAILLALGFWLLGELKFFIPYKTVLFHEYGTAILVYLATLFLNLHHQVDLAGMMFAGLWLLPFGLLVYRSRFLPRLLGVWLMLACFPYVALSLSGFLRPGTENKVFTYGQPLMLGELAIMLWLVIMGAQERKLADGAEVDRQRQAASQK